MGGGREGLKRRERGTKSQRGGEGKSEWNVACDNGARFGLFGLSENVSEFMLMLGVLRYSCAYEHDGCINEHLSFIRQC